MSEIEKAAERCCGTCRWFTVESPYTNGDCLAPVPNCVSYADRAGMDITGGRDCPVYEAALTPAQKEGT